MKYKKRILVIISALVLMFTVSVAIGYGESDISTTEADYETQTAELDAKADALSPYITSHQEILDAINDEGYLKAEDFKVQKYVMEGVTIEANDYTNSSLMLATNRTHKGLNIEGYVAKGVTGFAINNASDGGKNDYRCFMNRYYLSSDNTIYAIVRNTYTSASAVVDIECYVLYVKDEEKALSTTSVE